MLPCVGSPALAGKGVYFGGKATGAPATSWQMHPPHGWIQKESAFMGRLSANLSNLEHSMQSAHLRQLPRRGSRGKNLLPPPGEVSPSGDKGGVFRWRSHRDFQPLRGECTPSVASGASSPGGGAKILKLPPRRGSREYLASPSGGSATVRWQRGCISVAKPPGFPATSWRMHPLSLRQLPRWGSQGFARHFAVNAPPQSPPATAPPEGEPRFLSCTVEGGAEILKLPPRGGAKGFYYQNRYLTPALAFHCIS